MTAIAALAERVGVTTYPTYERGLNTEFRNGQARRYGGDVLDGEDPMSAVEMGQAIRELEAMAAPSPWTAPRRRPGTPRPSRPGPGPGAVRAGPELAARDRPRDPGRRGPRRSAAARPVLAPLHGWQRHQGPRPLRGARSGARRGCRGSRRSPPASCSSAPGPTTSTAAAATPATSRPASGSPSARPSASPSAASTGAATETATVWISYMDGAVRSGDRAADEVLAAS